MSVQFGRCNFDGKPVDPKELDRVRPLLVPYGPDGEGYLCKDSYGVLYRAFHTTKESRLERQPHILPSSFVITWDGRLDNRKDLIRQLEGNVSEDSTDLAIVAGAYERWRNDVFTRLIGDWAISIWDAGNKSLTLAKDFVGTRHLYYSVETAGVSWCTILDPLVLFADHTFPLEEEYLAGWLAFFPAAHLTPYQGIRSVPPSTFVCIQPGKHTIHQYWRGDSAKTIRYRTDAEYEAHFRSVFSTAVSRRLRSDSPVLAELSGGMDSSSIVCVGDSIIGNQGAATPRLDTVSFYDDAEPHWNERPYFAKVEERRGRKGCHVPVDAGSYLRFEFPAHVLLTTPASVGRSGEADLQLSTYTRQQGTRVLLSGIGGDEVTGGVPTPLPELEDLLARARLIRLARQLKAWSLNKRVPWFHLLFEALRGFLPSALCGTPAHRRSAPWIDPSFAARNRAALRGYENRLLPFGPTPSFQENMWALESLRRQLAYDPLVSEPLYEKRYPYLDRDLVEFMYSIPREQLVRPGQRRSLVRRALVNIVPDEILNRKRKAYVSRGPLAQIAARPHNFLEFCRHMRLASLGVIDSVRFSDALRSAAEGQQTPVVLLFRTLVLEAWIRHAAARNLVHQFRAESVDSQLPPVPRAEQAANVGSEFSLS